MYFQGRLTDYSAYERFCELPQRIFLDTSIVQTLLQYGSYIEDGETISDDDRIHKITNGLRNIEALREIIAVLKRSMFEIAVSRNTYAEVTAKKDKHLLRWLHDLNDVWTAQLDSYEGNPFTGKGQERIEYFDQRKLGFLGAKDKELLLDAVAFECDTFLTMEEKLSKNTHVIQSFLGIRILRPFEYWEMLKPFAALWL